MRARHIAILLAGFALLALGSTALGGKATSSATAIRIVAPPQSDVVVSSVSAPGAPAAGAAYAYPADGSVLSVQSTLASASAKSGAESDVTGISIFKGIVTADGVTAKASAKGASGNVVNLLVGGKPLGSGVQKVNLPMGTLLIGTQSQGSIVELDLTLLQPYAGLPAGAEIRIGEAQASVPPATTTTATTTPVTTTVSNEPPVGDRPEARPLPRKPVRPTLNGGPYDFPVFGPATVRGTEIFGTLGEPVVAVTGGKLFGVGFDKKSGYRLRLLDRAGDQFAYAHLAAFSTTTRNGAHVRAGQVIGFMGNTGSAAGTPVRLHFEVHPVSRLYLGPRGAVDPAFYLRKWTRLKELPFPVGASLLAALPGGGSVPEPGAILLGARDISSADGFDASALQHVLAAPGPATLMQTLVPTRAAPKGRG